MVIIHRCAHQAEASIILHALAQAGIPATAGDDNVSSLFPLPGFGPTIMVREQDVEAAREVLANLASDFQKAWDEASYHDVDHKEIAYLKSRYEEQNRTSVWWTLLVLLLLIMLIRIIFPHFDL